MKPLPHTYEVALSGGPNGYATLSTVGVPPLRSAPPKDFDGPGDAWSPEHLLLAAVETCFMFTFRAVAEASKFNFLTLDVSGSGIGDRKDEGYPLHGDRRVSHFRRVQTRNAQDGCLRKAKTPASASLSVPLRLEAELVIESA